ncbi:MarR family transcriptional regulator [Halomarina halobia]|uniref:MarR family transcriptional regulator n=1 Tax=Halomarina halobia TaxID=3033386 RepID=A0ABD6A9F4_9EURY|nr:MarR family transcriptional regulator [Halomarina sp. PSR21]
MAPLIEPAPHEFAANFLFDERGLRPYFATDAVVKEYGGSKRATFDRNGESWTVKLYYQDSNLVHPGAETHSGTLFHLETIREFRVHVESLEDDAGQRKFNAHLTPRWQCQKAEKATGEVVSINTPEGFEEGVNVRVQGSNIRFTEYASLLQQAFLAVGINRTYFRSPHEYSNVQDAARYVRLEKSESGPIHARDGPLVQLGHLLESDRQGYRKLVQQDDDQQGNNLPGYYHTVTLGPERIREAWPGHEVPKEFKHYYARHAATLPESDPLAHPKLEVAYQVSRWDSKIGVSQQELSELEQELDEALLSVLNDAEISLLSSAGGPYRSDSYFKAEVSERDCDIIGLDLTAIKSRQESVVVRYLAGTNGLSPVEWDALETLVADGGCVSPKDIAATTGNHVESVRRALRRIDDLVQRKYGEVALRSSYIAELVYEAVEEARESTRRAVELGARALDSAERGIDERTSAWLAWASRYCEDVRDTRSARMEIRLGAVKNSREIYRTLNQGYRLWCDAKQDETRFRSAQVVFEVNGRINRSDTWRYLE